MAALGPVRVRSRPSREVVAGRRRLPLIVGALGTYYLLAASIVAAFLWWPVHHLVAGQVDLPRLIGSLVLAVAVAARLILPPRRATQATPRSLVGSRDALWLHRLIDDACKALHLDVDLEVHLVNGFNAAVSAAPRGLLPGRRRLPRVVLRIGYGTLHVLTRTQLQAVIVHELAHVRAGDHRTAVFMGHVQRSFQRAAMTANRAEPTGVFAALGGWFGRRLAAVARAQEEAADSAARLVVGPRHLAGALRRLETAEALFVVFLLQTGTAISSDAASPQPYQRFACWLRKQRRGGDQPELGVRVFRAPPHVLDSHPPTVGRAAQTTSGSYSHDDDPGWRR